MVKTDLLANLRQFTGTEQYWKHPLWDNVSKSVKIVYTDGVQYLAANGASWLVDKIFAHVLTQKKLIDHLRDDGFIAIKLQVNQDTSAKLTFEDGNDKVLFSDNIDYTNFPQEGIELFLCADYEPDDGKNQITRGILMLTGEY